MEESKLLLLEEPDTQVEPSLGEEDLGDPA